jgi:Spy/CpxP family protein refolding chaperone
MNNRTLGFALAAGLMLAASTVGAHNPAAGRGGGGGCPGAGMGMMGPGAGMMGGMGMGSGAMGPGMGMGTGGGMGMGPGMMGGMGAGPFAMLNLSPEQRTKVNAIQDSVRKQHWGLQGKINDEEARLRDLYLVEQPDPKRVGQAYDTIFDLRRQMIEAQVQAQNDMRNVLTAEQRNQIRQFSGGAGAAALGQGQSPGGAAGASPPAGVDDTGCLMY